MAATPTPCVWSQNRWLSLILLIYCFGKRYEVSALETLGCLKGFVIMKPYRAQVEHKNAWNSTVELLEMTEKIGK
jgi:hypothetical protein